MDTLKSPQHDHLPSYSEAIQLDLREGAELEMKRFKVAEQFPVAP